jgi:two-component system, chemotaxis family, CheB/CheR fusion protein
MTNKRTGQAKKSDEMARDQAAESDENGRPPAERPDEEVSNAESAKPTEKQFYGAIGEFPIVGIGASAGGLAAFEAFFSGMPADGDPNMALVLVQHLAPDHKSMLTELIQRYTRMKVVEVEDGMAVHPNCVYIIPPGKDMALLGGVLQLLEPAEPRGQRMPIDFFFRSLAVDKREQAIGVILSGTGSDGSLGVRAIKGEGGMVMVQNPASTEHDGMPQSALATGLVDYELPPAEMPVQIISYVNRALGKQRIPVAATPPKADNSLKKIFILLRSQTGNDFSQYKPSTVRRRIERRMAIHQISSMEAYVKFLQQTPDEVEALFRDMLIGVTNFFRDSTAFATLEQQVIPQIFASKPTNGVIRIWSAGCSTGEEAYSLAILLAEHQETFRKTVKIQVFATDIDSQSIAVARAGIYPISIAADISPERFRRYFSAEPGGFCCQIQKAIRDMLVFSEQNVIRDPPFSKLDLISCRNLLIYVDSEVQKKLIPLFHYALNPGGFLFLGTSETVGEFSNLFTSLDRKAKLYQRQEGAHPTGPRTFLPPISVDDEPHALLASKTSVPETLSLRQLTETALLKHIDSVAALVSENGDILYLHGRTGLYLEPAPGEAGVNNILKMAREGLRRELAIALRRAAVGTNAVRCPNLSVKSNGAFTMVHLKVCALPTGPISETPAGSAMKPGARLLLVILEPATVPTPPDNAVASKVAITDGSGDSSDGEVSQALIAELRQELRTKDEYLQTANEELETANEELRSSNEEMQSVNEELQSTNEELETSKEELQSVNEELSTVNAELQTKVADLTRANNDMNNLLAGTGIATIFVDHHLRILRFTPTATRIINLIQTDIGRPVDHVVSKLIDYHTLTIDIQSVLETLTPRMTDVQTKTGVWYTMRILPYRTLDNAIEGAVITFVDISAAKLAQATVHDAHVRVTEALATTVREPLLVLDESLRVVVVNPPFCSAFHIASDDAIGRELYELGEHQWDIPALRKMLQEILLEDAVFHDRVISHHFGEAGLRTLRLNARMVRETNQSAFILLSIEDVTEQKAL